MSNYPGFYYYQKPVSCSECMGMADMYPNDHFPDCKKCHELNKVRVKLLKLSGRLFRHEAIIQYIDSGKLESVPMRCLTFGGSDEW